MLICLAAVSALALTYRLTKDKIEERAHEEQLRALKVVLPRATHFSDRKSGVEIDYYEGLDRDEKVVGYAFLGEARGYSSTIQVVVGIDPEGAVTGIEITEQKETPGLGSKAVEVPSTRTFVGGDPWAGVIPQSRDVPGLRPSLPERSCKILRW